eukprot:TRINITY_DN14889_c0_g1_i1.p1 TRINITY_DN14889_c0_g1~~TRINITY_DN14889_c0_g1_i1.p1  ORF type:complete len:197 (+),score=43.75 TRINITY_DN14889_c0_g1_i1:376-966(+)
MEPSRCGPSPASPFAARPRTTTMLNVQSALLSNVCPPRPNMARSTLFERVLLGLENGLEEIVQHGLLAGQDVHARGHARNDGQALAMVEHGVLLGAHLDPIIIFSPVVLDGVGRDVLHRSIETPVNGKVVGRNLDLGLLPGVQECDVGRLDLRLHQQGIVPVTYTHLTLPTKRIVQTSVVARVLQNKGGGGGGSRS